MNSTGHQLAAESSRAHRRWLAIIVSIVATLLLAPAVGAQQADDEDDAVETEFGESIFVEGTAETAASSSSVATKIPVPLRLTPASVGVVTSALSLEQDSRTVSDALVNISGVNVQAQFGVHDFFVIRGFDSLTGSLVLTDGIAEPEATFYQLYNVERVEVLKGPGSFLYGGNALSGTVDLVRKQPVTQRRWSVGLSGGSFETYRADFDYNTGPSSGSTSFRLLGQWGESDGYRDATSSETYALNPVLRIDTGESSNLHLNLEVLANDYSPDAGLPVAGDRTFDVPRRRSYQSPFDSSKQDLTRARVDWEGMTSSRLLLRNKTYFTELDWQSQGTIFAAVLDLGFATPLFRNLVLLDDRQTSLGNQFEALLSTEKHHLVFGVELTQRDDRFGIDVGNLPPIDVFDPVETATEPVPLIPFLAERGDAETRVYSPYFFDRFAVSDRFQIFWGARWDRIDFEDQLRQLSGEWEELSPMLGLLWAPNDQLSLYVNAGQGFSPPSTRSSADLEPEKSEQIEVGLKGSLFERRLQFGLSVYDLERQNIAIVDGFGFTTQTGTQRSRGVEVDFAGALGRGAHWQFAAAYNDSELTEFRELVFVPPTFFPVIIDYSGNTAAFAPDLLLSFWIAKNFSGGLSVGGGGRLVDSQYIDEDNAFQIGDRFSVDATVSYQFERLRLSLNLKNLTDEEYDLRGFSPTSVIPADGTAAFVGVTFTN